MVSTVIPVPSRDLTPKQIAAQSPAHFARDYSQYQYVAGGETLMVSDMTVEQLREALADSIDVMETMDEQVDNMVQTLRKWRTG